MQSLSDKAGLLTESQVEHGCCDYNAGIRVNPTPVLSRSAHWIRVIHWYDPDFLSCHNPPLSLITNNLCSSHYSNMAEM